MRYLVNLTYDGSKFYGYQVQNDKKTVEGEIEKVLSKIFNKKINTIGASRTDRGVHAVNQYCHFDIDKDVNVKNLVHSMNSLLGKGIYIKKINKVTDSFHARYDVIKKEYIYKINMGEYDPISKDYVLQYCKKLDVVEIERALKYIEGTHDFKSFTAGDDVRDDYVRTIIQTNLIRDLKNVNMITISFLGTGFMRYMVRNLVGTLIQIGEGKYKSTDIIDILDAKDRRKAGMCADACGLYLKDVFYR